MHAVIREKFWRIRIFFWNNSRTSQDLKFIQKSGNKINVKILSNGTIYVNTYTSFALLL